MLQSSLPTFVLRHRFYRPAAGTPPLRNAEFGVRNAERNVDTATLIPHSAIAKSALEMVESMGTAPI